MTVIIVDRMIPGTPCDKASNHDDPLDVELLADDKYAQLPQLFHCTPAKFLSFVEVGAWTSPYSCATALI